MLQFFRDRREYAELRQRLIRKALLICQEMDASGDDLLVQAFRKANMTGTGDPMSGGRRTPMRTPIQLKPLLQTLLAYPPVLSAWLVLYRIGRALAVCSLPIHVQGDVMMAFEVTNYVLPENTEKGADHLAHALCMMPSLWRARGTLWNLGGPFTTKPVTKEEMTVLMKQGHLPPDAKASAEAATVLGWNSEMRDRVADAIVKIDQATARLLRVTRFRAARWPPLQRWPHPLDESANEILNEGIELAGQGDFEKAWDRLTEAGQRESLLLPDVLRNQEWIRCKQKRYHEAATFARQALVIAPEYAEVWYALGIDLARLRCFTEALNAYEKAKSLGFRSGGLESNIAVCRRAIADGLQ